MSFSGVTLYLSDFRHAIAMPQLPGVYQVVFKIGFGLAFTYT